MCITLQCLTHLTASSLYNIAEIANCKIPIRRINLTFRVGLMRRAPVLYSGGFSFEIWPETDSPNLYASWFLSIPTNAKTPEDAMASFHIPPNPQCIVHGRPPNQW